jgi:uroporphyrinogen-III synthase
MSGLRVVVTRSSEQASRLSLRLREHGYEPVEVPVIEVRQSAAHRDAVDAAFLHVESFAWVVFTSPNAVDVSLSRERVSSGQLPRIAAVGPGTAERIRQYGVEPSIVAETSSGQGLVTTMADVVPSTVLIPQAAGARPDVVDGLRTLGWDVTMCESYETVAVQPSDGDLDVASRCDVIAFASSSAVESWARAWSGAAGAPSLVALSSAALSSVTLSRVTPDIVVSIGPQTTATALRLGLTVAEEADPHTLDGLVAAVGRAAQRLLG